MALGVVADVARPKPGCHGRGRKSRGIDHDVRVEVEIPATNADAGSGLLEIGHLRQIRDRTPGGLDVPEQAQHEGVAVDDAGGLRVHARDGLHLGLECRDVGGGQPGKLPNPVDERLALVGL